MSGAIGNVAGQAARTALEAAYKHLPAAVMKMNVSCYWGPLVCAGSPLALLWPRLVAS